MMQTGTREKVDDVRVGELTKKRQPPRQLPRCRWCRQELTKRPKNARFCIGGSCKTQYNRTRRAGMVAAISSTCGLPADVASDVLERIGAARATRFLQKFGWQYEDAARKWCRG